MRKLLTLFLIGFLILPLSTYASIYGTLKGKVVDEEGKPVIGATVRVMGTPRGTYVKEKDGRFTIVNINSGEYQVQVTAVGYSKYTITARISADETTEINVKLISEIKKMGEVNVIGTKEMVNNTEIGTKRKITSDQISNVAREGIQQVIAMSAGVVSGYNGNGYNIRGSRETESQIRINGLDVGSQFTGGFGQGGINYFPMISQLATEEVQVLTGDFSAEYGNALGGIVNTVAKSGNTEIYDGYMRWRTDLNGLWGSALSDIKLVDDGSVLSAVHTGSGPQYQGPNQNKIEFGVGGPIPILNNSSFYLSTTYMYEKYRNSSYEIYAPVDRNNPTQAPQNMGQMPNNRSWVKNISLNTKFGISNDIYLSLYGMWGLTNLEAGNNATLRQWYYANDVGIINGVSNGLPERVAKQVVFNTLITNIMARINHTLTSKSFYEFTVSNNTNGDETSKRNLYPDYSVDDFINGRYPSADEIRNPKVDPDFFTGFNLWYPTDVGGYNNNYQFVKGANRIIDEFESTTTPGISADGFLKMASRIINPITGYIEGDADFSGTRNPYGAAFASDMGILNPFVTHGNSRNFEFRNSNYWQIDGSYTQSIDGEFSHMLKAGMDLRFYQLDRHQNSLPWTDNPFFDVYTDKWGGNLYAPDTASWEATSKPYKPISGGIFAQDQIRYKDIIISPGLRVDFFLPQSRFRLPSDKFVSIMDSAGFDDSKLKVQVSPRINIAYPITERSKVNISYGMYFKIPELQNLYDGFGSARLRGNQILGNPNIDAQKENSYSIAYTSQLSDDFAFDVTAYYKDIYNQIGTLYRAVLPIPYYQYTVSEYGNSKGLEFTFRKRANQVDHIGFEINYVIASVTGTSTNAGDNYLLQTDPFTGQQTYPLTEYPLNYDRTHKVNFNLNFNWGENQGPSIAGIQPLENTVISLTSVFQTGRPYTKVDLKGQQVGEKNGERGPTYWMTDLRLSKQFYFKDWFGEGAGKTSIEFFIDIFNLFNRRTASDYYVITNDPDNDGVSFYIRKGSFSAASLYKEADFSIPASLAADQYDNFGIRKYNANADFDHNNIETQEEKFIAYQNMLEDAKRLLPTYLVPMRIWFGISFKF
ncbi:MAG: TonB-dependent receptor [Ignavibacteriae bacterium]|nr:TonB-dependent receptor [Ignavibacteriota bacterium]